jgi:hypothetical protein
VGGSFTSSKRSTKSYTRSSSTLSSRRGCWRLICAGVRERHRGETDREQEKKREGRGECGSPLRERGEGLQHGAAIFSPATFPIGYNIPHTAINVSSRNCLCPHPAISVSSCYYMSCNYEEERQLECVCVCVCVCMKCPSE